MADQATRSPPGDRPGGRADIGTQRRLARFGGLRVIDELNLTVRPGEILGVLGPNGAGKSTLFNLIAGVLPPNEGAILFMGRDVTTMKVWVRRRLGIGRTYQVPKPFAHMSVFENVLVAAIHGGGLTIAAGRREAHEALALTGLAAHRAPSPAGHAVAARPQAARTRQGDRRQAQAVAARRDRRRPDRRRMRRSCSPSSRRSMREGRRSSGSSTSSMR